MTLRSRFEPAWLHTVTAKYALVLVWAAMAGVYLVLMPTRFGSFGTFSSIFGIAAGAGVPRDVGDDHARRR